jgi:hypothetical protein
MTTQKTNFLVYENADFAEATTDPPCTAADCNAHQRSTSFEADSPCG